MFTNKVSVTYRGWFWCQNKHLYHKFTKKKFQHLKVVRRSTYSTNLLSMFQYTMLSHFVKGLSWRNRLKWVKSSKIIRILHFGYFKLWNEVENKRKRKCPITYNRNNPIVQWWNFKSVLDLGCTRVLIAVCVRSIQLFRWKKMYNRLISFCTFCRTLPDTLFC